MNLRIISTIALTLLIMGCNTSKSTIEKSVTTKNYTFELIAVDEERAMNVEAMSKKDASV